MLFFILIESNIFIVRSFILFHTWVRNLVC